MKSKRKILSQFLITAFMLTFLFSAFGVVSYAAGDAKPDVADLGEEAKFTVLSGKSNDGVWDNTSNNGLFDGTVVNEWRAPKVYYFGDPVHYIEIQIDDEFRIWKSGTTNKYNNKLKTLQWNGSEYVDITDSQPTLTSTLVNEWELITSKLPAGKYRFEHNGKAAAEGYRLDSEWYIEKVSSSQQGLSLDIEASSYDIKGGTNFETFTVIKNAKSIYAEDINIKYDKTLFELVSAESVNSSNIKIYHEKTATEGEARYVVASKGSSNGLDGDEQILKLTFKAKNIDGSGDIEVSSGLVADGEGNETTPAVGGKTFKITKGNLGDVNKDGKFSLGDLAIAGRLFESNSSEWGSFEPDVDANGDVEDVDLSSIVQSILDNE